MASANFFHALSPSAFRSQLASASSTEFLQDYAELVANCRALHVKASATIASRAADIRSGPVVDFSRDYAGSAGLQVIAPLLARNSQLRALRMPANGLQNDAVILFCRTMRAHPALESVDFSNNNLSLAAGLAMLNLVRQCPTLRCVSLSRTAVPEGVLHKISVAATLNMQRSPGRGAALAVVCGSDSAAVEVGADVCRYSTASSCEHHGGAIRAAAPPAAEEGLTQKSPLDGEVRTEAGAAHITTDIPAGTGTAATSACAVAQRAAREKRRQKAWREQEVALLGALQSRLLKSPPTLQELPPADLASGWRVLEVAVVATPGLFDSEVELLLHEVFPRLNEALVSRRVRLVPLVNHWAPSTRPATTSARERRLTLACDVLADVRRSRFATIELIGDCAGALPLPPASTTTSRDDAAAGDAPSSRALSALTPILYTAHEVALERSRWLLVATRLNTKYMKVPPTLAPLLSQEPEVAYPDVHAEHLVTTTIGPEASSERRTGEPGACSSAATTKVRSASEHVVSHDEMERCWKVHTNFRRHAVLSAPLPELVIAEYPAVFAGTSEEGSVRLVNLGNFTTAVFERLRLLTSVFPVVVPPHNVAALCCEPLSDAACRSERCQQHLVDVQLSTEASSTAPHKKSVTNRVELYAATPQSRNALLLHSATSSSLTSLLAICVARWRSMPYAFTVAAHTTHNATVREEPTDIRDALCHLLSQATSNPEVLHYLKTEVNVHRLQRFFYDFISSGGGGGGALAARAGEVATGATADAALSSARLVAAPKIKAQAAMTGDGSASSQVLVLVLDGADALVAPPLPCAALGLDHAHGVEGRWPTVSTAVAAVAAADALIPQCLGRHVRVITSAASSSALSAALMSRGRDSVEVLAAPAGSPYDAEVTLTSPALARVGVVLAEEDVTLAREKPDASQTEYLRYVLDAVRRRQEEPGFASQTELIRDFPGTLAGASQDVLQRLRRTFGGALTAKVLGLLDVVRWGIPVAHLRELLCLAPQRFNQLLRLLRPVVEPAEPTELGGECGNALCTRVRLVAPSFLALLTQERLEKHDHSEADSRTWHRMLTDFYSTIARKASNAESSPRFARESTSPLERHAVKELAYHALLGHQWETLDQLVLSPAFMMLVYRHALGYHYGRDLVAAFNYRHERLVMGEVITSDAEAASHHADGQLPEVLRRHREYILFALHHGSRLVEFPSLVLQAATESGDEASYVRHDALEHLRRVFNFSLEAVASLAFFRQHQPSRAAAHYGSVSHVLCAVRGRCSVTAGDDRSLCWVDNATGVVVYRARGATARLVSLHTCRTGAYVVALDDNRQLEVFDAAEGKQVSRTEGLAFNSPIAAVCLSTRGRYYYVVTENIQVYCMDTERSRLCFTLTAVELCPSASPSVPLSHSRVPQQLLPDVEDDEAFTTIVGQQIISWRINSARDGSTATATEWLPVASEHASWCGPAVVSKNRADTNNSSAVSEAPARSYVLIQSSPQDCLRLCALYPLQEVARLEGANMTEEEKAGAGALRKAPVVFSRDQRWVAVHNCGRRVHLFRLDWEAARRALFTHTQPPRTVTPDVVLDAFSATSGWQLQGVLFDAKSAHLYALGAHRVLRCWSVARLLHQAETEASKNLEAVPEGECMLDQTVTSWDVVPTSPDHARYGADLFLGHNTGYVSLLSLWRPIP